LIDENCSEKEQQSCNIVWIDTSGFQTFLSTLKPWQKINHFPGMIEVSRKTRLAYNLETMRKGFKNEYDFFPKTYIIPRDISIIKEAFGYFGRSKHAFIIKPDGGCQGRGIFLTKSFRDLKELKTTHVAQHYISDPFLIEGKKFDLRVYVLVTSCSPLHVYLFKDGLVRMCTEDFAQPTATNMDHKCMHLTNFAINKNSDHFVGNNDESGSSGSKRSIKWFLSSLSDEKGTVVADQLWTEIGHICSKTILSIAPILAKEYSSVFGTTLFTSNLTLDNTESIDVENHDGICTESAASNQTDCNRTSRVTSDRDNQNRVGNDDSKNKVKQQAATMSGSRSFTVLGFDILVDSSMKPYLIEVNELPSFASGSPLDESIKSKVCYQALSVIQCSPSDQRKYEALVRKRMMERCRRSGIRGSDPASHHSGELNNKKVMMDFRASIKQIYAKCAPEKLHQVDSLFQKYRGNEKLLFRRVAEKYNYHESKSKQEDILDQMNVVDDDYNHAGCIPEDFEFFLREYQLLVEHGDFDRIYPPCGGRRKQLWEIYKEMEQYAKEQFEQEQKRIVFPLWLQRKSNKNTDSIEVPFTSEKVKEYRSSAASKDDCYCYQKGANELEDASRTMSSNKPSTKKQSEASERLTRGFSADQNKMTAGETKLTIKRLRKRKETHGKQKMTLKLRPINLEFAKQVIEMKKIMKSAESKE